MIRALGVFCGSRSGTDERFTAVARSLGHFLAEQGVRLVYGGGSVGLMGEVANACLEAGGEVHGVITHDLMAREVGHAGLTELVQVSTMAERKHAMAERADAFVSLPGGVGTLDELFEMVTWTQLRIHDKPNGLLNVAGYYDGLIAFYDTMIERGFLPETKRDQLLVDDDWERLWQRLNAFSRSLAVAPVSPPPEPLVPPVLQNGG